MLKKLALLVVPLLFLVPSVFAATYVVDVPHSQVHFKVRHLMAFTVRGTFDDFAGQVEVDTDKKTLTGVTATVDPASIDTRNEKRNAHLKSADFFDVQKFPEMSFVSKTISGSGDNITLVGELTMKGVTREVTLHGSFDGATVDPWGNKRVGFSATGKIDRRDFGLNWNKALEAGGVMVGETVEIGLEIEAIEKA